MTQPGDKPFDWVAGIALISGAVVLIVSLAALAVTLMTVVVTLL